MAYRIKRRESVPDAVRRIAREQVEKAIVEIHDDSVERAEAIHGVRKRCKKLRALLRLVRSGNAALYKTENAFFRDLARGLSDARDLDAMLETLSFLAERFGDEIGEGLFARVRGVFETRRGEYADDAIPSEQDLGRLSRVLQESASRIDGWKISGDGFDAIEGGLRKSYRRGRKALPEAYRKETAEAFHEWRKRVKYHGYHTRLLRDSWKSVMKNRRSVVDGLADQLGREHDLAVLQEALETDPGAFGSREDVALLLTLAGRRRDIFQAEARPAGERIFAEKPGRFTKRLEHFWEVWKREMDCFEI